MRGHEPLLALRRRGAAPSSVWISDGDDAAGFWRDWPTWSRSAHVEIQPSDSIALLDLRFVVGLLVFASSHDRGRAEALHRACVEAGAKRVMTDHFERVRGQLESVEDFDSRVPA